MDQQVEDLVQTLWRDLRKTWSSLTLEWLREEAERQLAGERPRGGPGVMLADYLKRLEPTESE